VKTKPTERPPTPRRKALYEVIFEAETPAGRAFDLVLACLIVLSVLSVILESVRSIGDAYGRELHVVEWVFTVIFTIEYILRLIAVKRPLRYAASFYGVIDFIAVFPSYIGLLVPGTQYFLAIRILRLLRIFRILKLAEYTSESRVITAALFASRRKIGVFLFAIVMLVTAMGSIMYVIEGEENGFTDIPTSIYWAIVTMTTVGYGDLSPKTPLGKLLASAVMIMGYSIIAVPTGIVTAEIARGAKPASTEICPNCHAEGHDVDAVHCKYCGAKL
jgi:voltage-gated potassium channel